MSTLSNQIQRVLDAKAEALVSRNAEALASLIHGDFTYVNAGGKIFDKSSYIETYSLSGSLLFLEQRFSDLAVKALGECAVATMSIADTFLIDGQRVGGRFKSLCVFCLSSGRWQWAAGQTMKHPAE
ncbi:nuclear transport factor 2 family protein [Bosea sp. 2KB_26]|uniref:nuclear transport factor 2 family protein n=1 Tax=Bosea sp. 2KB_26 TaxID=3237475 RepID=UPI003F90B5E0